MANRIDIVLATGELEELKDLQRDDDVLAVRSLRLVHGVGIARAMKFIEEGIRSLTDLRRAVGNGTVHLDKAQTLGLAHAEELARRIPRMEMVEHEVLLLNLLKEHFPESRGIICGSYRRGARTCGDI